MRHKLFFSLWLLAGMLFFGVFDEAPALAQPPQPPGSQVPDLRPQVRLSSVSLNGGAQKPLTALTGVPIAVPEFTVPRSPVAGTSWVLEVRTSDGRGTITFSNTVPAGVQASAFQWEQSSGPSPGAVGRLRYNGCAGCAASFTFEVSVRDNLNFSGAAPRAQVRLNLTASGGPPRLLNVTRSGGGDVQPRFQVTFAQGTFAQADSEVIAAYSGGFRYRILPESIGAETMFAVIPRLKASRAVEVTIRNPFGSSSRNVDLPIQAIENAPLQFNCVTCSVTSGEANIHDEFSVRHDNIGPINASGTDEITITPRRSGTTPCDEPDFIYHTAVMRWIHNDGYSGDSDETGTVRISSQPQVDHLLRSPDNKLRVAWMLRGLKGTRFYQVMFGVIDVVGVCQNRIVQ